MTTGPDGTPPTEPSAGAHRAGPGRWERASWWALLALPAVVPVMITG